MYPLNKVYAYITRRNQLLVFSHIDFPEAGVQGQGGTMKDGEPPDVEVMREASEETGLEGLRMASYLGEFKWRSSGIGHRNFHLRHFYHNELILQKSICTANSPANQLCRKMQLPLSLAGNLNSYRRRKASLGY